MASSTGAAGGVKGRKKTGERETLPLQQKENHEERHNKEWGKRSPK